MNLADLFPQLAAIVDEAGGLPSTLSVPQASQLYGVSSDHGYALVRDEQWPSPVIRLGRAVRIPTVPLLEALGLWPLDSDPTSRHPSSARPYLAVVSS